MLVTIILISSAKDPQVIPVWLLWTCVRRAHFTGLEVGVHPYVVIVNWQLWPVMHARQKVSAVQ